MTKIALNDVSSGYLSSVQLNANFQTIIDHLQNKVLYRDNPVGEPNALESDLDMNNNDILNAQLVSAEQLEAAILSLGGVTIIGGQGAGDTGNLIEVSNEYYTLTAGQTIVTFNNSPSLGSVYVNGPDVDAGKLLVNLDYTVSGNDVILTGSYPAGTVITLLYSDFTAAVDNTIFQVENVALTSGQLGVTFSNQLANAGFYISGPGVDDKRLFPGQHLNIDGTNDITLFESYPAGSVITLVYNNDMDLVQASQASSVEYINNLSVTSNLQVGMVNAEDDIDNLQALSAANAAAIEVLETNDVAQDSTLVDHENRISALEAASAASAFAYVPLFSNTSGVSSGNITLSAPYTNYNVLLVVGQVGTDQNTRTTEFIPTGLLQASPGVDYAIVCARGSVSNCKIEFRLTTTTNMALSNSDEDGRITAVYGMNF